MKITNALSSTGKVHRVSKVGTRYTLACNKNFNLGIDGWFLGWMKTDTPITCCHCRYAKDPVDTKQALTNLGDLTRKTNTDLLVKFLDLSKTCKYRKATCYRRDCGGKRYYAYKCTNPDDEDPNFGWGCTPNTCPYIGHLTGSEWAYQIEEKPTAEEIRQYEESKER